MTQNFHTICRGVLAATVLNLALTPGDENTAAAEAERRPNVVIVMTDDQGSVDAGCYGAKDLETPHLDALAARGVRFTQFYAASSVCSPSRAGLLTGRFPARAGVPGNCPSEEGAAGMPGHEVTLAETFKAAGYRTAHIGKWHLGYSADTMPNAQGFDYSFGHMGGCIDNYSHFFYWRGPNRHDLHRNGQRVYHDGEFFPDLMVREATQFIEQNKDEPFLLYFAMNAPHYPYQGGAKWLERFAGLEYPRNLYAAFVGCLDERLGALLAVLDRLDLRQHTIVVFQSDNGHSTEERAHFGGGSAGPYRGAKSSMFEGGLRVPAVISWPGKIPAGEVRGQVAHAVDWLPTLADLAGVKLVEHDIDGKSLQPLLMSPAATTPHDVLHWQIGRGPNARWAVRRGDWKLMGNTTDNADPQKSQTFKLFLANLTDDPGEQTNYAEQLPEIVRELLDLRQQWVERHAP